jgi:hypothetical protein
MKEAKQAKTAKKSKAVSEEPKKELNEGTAEVKGAASEENS